VPARADAETEAKKFAASKNQNQNPRQGQQLGLPMKAILSSHTYFELSGHNLEKKLSRARGVILNLYGYVLDR
jgi:hypothetical protein